MDMLHNRGCRQQFHSNMPTTISQQEIVFEKDKDTLHVIEKRLEKIFLITYFI